MTKEDEIKKQRFLIGKLQHIQCAMDTNGYVYSQEIADQALKEYEEYTEKLWKKYNESST